MQNSNYNALTVACFDKHADNYAQKYFDLSDYHPYYDLFLADLPASAACVLDLACGPGNVAAYLQRARADLNLYCLDLSAAMLAQVRLRVPQAQVLQADCRDLSQLIQQFDGAAFCFGLSYFNDDDAHLVLTQLHQVLLPGASLLLATVAGAAQLSGVQSNAAGDQVVSFYRSQAEIEKLISIAGFEISLSTTLASPANASLKTEDVVILARAC